MRRNTQKNHGIQGKVSASPLPPLPPTFEGAVRKYFIEPELFLTIASIQILHRSIKLPNLIEDASTKLLLNHVQYDSLEGSTILLCFKC